MIRILTEDFGCLPDGLSTQLYTVQNQCGASVALLDYGARVVRLCMPDRSGATADVALGHDTLLPYIDADDCLGATCGRVANRINGGRFTLNGRSYQITRNSGEHTLHGGVNGLHRRLWRGERLSDGVRFTYDSPDGEEGFPGNLQMAVCYRLSDDNVLSIEYEAVSDADTYVNLTNHTYFNLAGHGSGDIHGHWLQLFAAYYTPVNSALIPLGEIASVAGTPFDFLTAKPIGRDIGADCEQIRRGGGYDHNFVLHKPERGVLSLAARVKDSGSGREMEVWTTMPGIQLYTGNFLTRQAGKDGAVYDWRGALCLETQFFPDSMTHTHFPSPVLRAFERSGSKTEYRFL